MEEEEESRSPNCDVFCVRTGINIHAEACEELRKIERETSLLFEIADFILNREK